MCQYVVEQELRNKSSTTHRHISYQEQDKLTWVDLVSRVYWVVQHYDHFFFGYIILNFLEITFDRIELDNSLMKLSKASMSYMHGIDSFLNYAFDNGNHGKKFMLIQKVL